MSLLSLQRDTINCNLKEELLKVVTYKPHITRVLGIVEYFNYYQLFQGQIKDVIK